MDPILINRLKWFAERFVFVEIFKFKVQKIGLCTVFVCAESTPHRVCLRGVDSAQCLSAQSQLRIVVVCEEPIKKQTKMLVYAEIVHIYFFINVIFSFKARRGLQRQNSCLQNSAQCKSLLDIKKFNSLTPRNTARSLTPAVLVNFGFSKDFRKYFEKSTYGP